MRNYLLSALLVSSLVASGFESSAQSLVAKLKENSIKGKIASKEAEKIASKDSPKKATKKTPKKATKKSPVKTTKSTASKSRVAAGENLSLPTLETMYYYDETSEDWIVSGYYKNEYDNNGNIILQAYFYEINGDTLSKTVYEYDEEGNEIGYYYYNRENGMLVLSSASTEEYTYDPSGRLQSVMYNSYSQGVWDYDGLEIYGYNGMEEVPNAITFLEWDGSEFVQSEVITQISWYDFANFEVKTYQSEYVDEDDGETYIVTYASPFPGYGIEFYVVNGMPVKRYTETTDEQGNTTSIKEDYINDIWVNSYKSIDYVDVLGNYAGYDEFEWVDGTWVKTYSSTYTNTYNEEGILLQQETATINREGNEYFSKTVYSEFETFVITSTNNAVAALEIKAFPNPASDVLNIQLPNQESATVQVYNMQNVLVQTSVVEAGNGSVNISNLASGVYMLQVQTASGLQKTERIVKK